jgi:hypothetical protein
MEITDVLDRLAAEDRWRDGQRLDVTFRPLTLVEPSADAPQLEIATLAHPDLPITIGRVSVHFA